MNFDPRAVSLLARLNQRGHSAHLVGGCVRDALMGKSPHDYDVTTAALPQEIKAAFDDVSVIETGIRHGTVTVLWEGLTVEVTTHRVDGSYADGRHPDEVTFTDRLTEDLARRDFTVNAMAWSPAEGLSDPFGGQADLSAGILRAVGDPDRRFTEDGLRILRGLRFASVLGFSLEPATAAALVRQKERLCSVSAERIREEFVKLLCGKDAPSILKEFSSVITVFLPELAPQIGFDQRNFHHCHDLFTHTLTVLSHVPPLPHLRLAALLHDVAKPETASVDASGVGHYYGHAALGAQRADEILRRLRFDNATRERIVTLIRHHDGPLEESEGAVRKKLNKLGDLFFDYLALCRADTLGLAPEFHHRIAHFDRLEGLAREILAQNPCLSVGDLAVNGNDLKALGLVGPAIGRALACLLDEVLEGRIPNVREELLARAKEMQ